MTFTLAHLSDVHLGPIRGLAPRHVNIKRALGLANWHLKRRHIHLPHVVEAIVDDVHHQRPDHIAVTGDLVNLGLPGEFEHAARWLEALGPPDRVTVVPGNHDIYTPLRRDAGIERWRPYMAGEQTGPAQGFPFVRRIGPLALIGVNSALPRPPFIASGRVGGPQLQALSDLLGRLGKEGVIRVVLIHHPPLPGQAPARRGLEDAAAVSETLAHHGAELVLHGHNHIDMIAERPSRTGTTTVLGVASSSIGHRHKSEPLGRYNCLRFEPGSGGVRIELVVRGLAGPDGPVIEIARQDLTFVGVPASPRTMP
jgi:3',5'-cyclic AMP phosphodiesterase CpdA